jgi:hypothetical protein
VVIAKARQRQEAGQARPGMAPPAFVPAAAEVHGGYRYSPWDDIDNLGFFTAFFETLKQVLFSPGRFFREMPVNQGIGRPLFYGVLIGTIGGLITLLWQYISTGLVQGVNFIGTSSILIWAILSPIFIAVGLFIAAGVLHLSLMIVGGNRRGFETTFRVISYANSTQVFSIIPVLGAIITVFYNIVLYIIGFKESHGISTGRATVALFLPMVLVILLIVALVIMIVVPMIAAMSMQ